MYYTANLPWDMAMYLRYFQVNFHLGPTVVNFIEYKTSGAGMNKFGHTDKKSALCFAS